MEKETLRKVNMVVTLLAQGPKTIEELTKAIYKDSTSIHLGFIYTVLSSHMDTGFVVPVIQHKKLLFMIQNHPVEQTKVEATTEETKPHEEYAPGRAPNGTYMFLHWLEKQKIGGKKEINITEFIGPDITREQAEKIFAYQIKQGSIQQISKDAFRVLTNG